ncbi:MAG: hypothetical protein RMM08_00075 [Armatimonadota bacterium]|nr:hypothetical protein [Armatimonadota bacterium]
MTLSSPGFALCVVGALLCAACVARPSQELPSFDFTRPETVAEWQPTHHISRVSHSPAGMVIEISGYDPYTHGPVREFPENVPLWLEIRLKSEQQGMLQIFYARAGQGSAEERSVRRVVNTTDWVILRMPLPALGPRAWIRLDPPGTSGRCTVEYIRFTPRITPLPIKWQPPVAEAIPKGAPAVVSGSVRVTFHPNNADILQVSVKGQPMAVGWNRAQLCYEEEGGSVSWFDLHTATTTILTRERNGVRITRAFRDPHGAAWRIVHIFTPSSQKDAIDVRTVVTVDHDRKVYFLPLLVLFPGVGSFGQEKEQALFAGLEYLENEPSSSEADIVGPASKRQVPDTLKITAPLMVVQAHGRYVGLIWQPANHFSALFDSPDRIFRSGGHVMGVLYPGSNGDNREEGNLLPYFPETLQADTPLVLDAVIIGGEGDTVIPAVQQYVRLRGLPPVPNTDLDAQGYLKLAAAGWLDSKIREGNLYRHAVWPGFGPQHAADAAVWMEWIAAHIQDSQTARRLRQAAQEAIAIVPREQYLFSRVSHVAFPVAPLLYGAVPESITAARNAARDALRMFQPDGTVLYEPRPGGTDYARTHWERTANGFTGGALRQLLEMALYSGDKQLIAEGIRRLEQFKRFDNTVPRGAQTWEMPLHTPDILASAHIVKAYVIGYELTGNPEFLRRARYWAWTGVPFPYLINPTGQQVGPYSVISVLGATNWSAPVWFGQPVQWCGLVYADALYWLARLEPKAHWKQIADGITAAGVQHTWKQDDPERQGLLPDFYHLREQRSDGPAINPGTVQANAVRLYNLPAVYDYRVLRHSGVVVHAPGTITVIADQKSLCKFQVKSWIDKPYYVLINGLSKPPQVRLNAQNITIASPHQYLQDTGNLILQVRGDIEVEITTR